MSNRRKVRPNARPDNNWVNRWAASIDGAQIPGGCDTCDAYQTAHVIDRGITRIAVHHDDRCPPMPDTSPRSSKRIEADVTTSLVSAACVTDSAAAALYTPEALAEARHALHTTSWPWPHHWTEFDVADHLRAFRAEGWPV